MVLGKITTFYKAFRGTVDALGTVKEIHDNRVRDLRILFEDINDSKVTYGDTLRVEGTFSEYVPVARDLAFENSKLSTEMFIDPLPINPVRIGGYHCGSIQLIESSVAADPVCLPVFYTHETKRPIEEDLSGQRVLVDGKLVSLPGEWNHILDTEYPVGIQAESIRKQDSQVENLGILPWKVVRIEDKCQEIGEGSYFLFDDLWSMTFRLDSNKALVVNGWGTEYRHGGPDENHENIHDLYMVDLLGDEFEKLCDYHSRRFKDQKVDAAYDVQRHNYNLTNWLERHSG